MCASASRLCRASSLCLRRHTVRPRTTRSRHVDLISGQISLFQHWWLRKLYVRQPFIPGRTHIMTLSNSLTAYGQGTLSCRDCGPGQLARLHPNFVSQGTLVTAYFKVASSIRPQLDTSPEAMPKYPPSNSPSKTKDSKMLRVTGARYKHSLALQAVRAAGAE